MTVHEPTPARRFQDPPETRHVIRNGILEAVLQPLAGGRMLSLRHVDHGDLLVPLENAAFFPAHWPKAGAFPLFPFHNRVRDGAFGHDGRTIRLQPNTPVGTDVMHGPAHRHPWRACACSQDFIEMVLAFTADEDWPFDFIATQRFALDGTTLTVEMRLTNCGTGSMPGGIGWHPYFRPSSEGTIETVAARRWEPFGPVGLSAPVDQDAGGREGPIPHDMTRHYSGWSRATARIDGGATISLSGGGALSCLVVLRKSRYLCLEPASHVAGALGARPDPIFGAGMRVLSPGESLEGQAVLSVL